MAFYEYDATRQAIQTIGPNDALRTDGVGAYFAYDASHEAVQPINGLALGASAELADDAVRSIIGRRGPLLVAREWATRVTDVQWKGPSSQDELTLLPLYDQDLAAVKNSAFGHDVPMVGVLSSRSPTIANSEGAFVDTPYAFNEQIAVYASGDTRQIPLPLFLTTASLRDADDPDGGSGSLMKTAQALGGRLVYIVALPPKTPARLLPMIQLALSHYMPATNVAAKHGVAGAPPPPPTPSRVNLSGPSRRGFRHPGMLGLGTMSTSTMLTVGVVAIAGIGIAAAVIRHVRS